MFKKIKNFYKFLLEITHLGLEAKIKEIQHYIHIRSLHKLNDDIRKEILNCPYCDNKIKDCMKYKKGIKWER